MGEREITPEVIMFGAVWLCIIGATLCYGLLWLSQIGRGKAHTTTPQASARAHQPPPASTLAMPASTPPLAPQAWLDRLNNQPDKTPHLAVSGPSGSGKTSLVLAALHDRPGQLVICTPKSRRADPWGDFPAVRLRQEDMSFEPIALAVQAVYSEMLRRNADDEATEDLPWLTVVVDEYSTVIGKCPELRDTVLDLVTLGRSSRVRVIICATETNVKAWGWEGRGEARHNCLFVECEEDTYRAWAYRWGKEKHELDTRSVPKMVDQTLHTNRAFAAIGEPLYPAIERYSSHDSTPSADSIAWQERVQELAVDGKSTRAILRELGGDYNQIVRLSREAKQAQEA